MKLSNTAQYAINIMVSIAKHKGSKLLNAKSISEKLDIPYKYLTRIAPKLVNANLILSTRGREGGYALAKEPSEIYVIDIMSAIQESIYSSKCILKAGMCDEENKCALHDSWKAPQEAIKIMFKDTTLESIVR